MDNLNTFLTSLVQQGTESRTEAEHPSVAGQKLYGNKLRGSGNKTAAPLTAVLANLNSDSIPSLLTRARLSPATRAAEERRLAKIQKKKDKLTSKPKRSKGARHWKRKEATKVRDNRKRFEKTSGFNAIINSYGAKAIDPLLWDKYIGECFREYTNKYLTVKKIKRAPGQGRDAYYGNKKFPMTVYSFRVHHATLGVVWDGEVQRQQDGVPVLVVDLPSLQA